MQTLTKEQAQKALNEIYDHCQDCVKQVEKKLANELGVHVHAPHAQSKFYSMVSEKFPESHIKNITGKGDNNASELAQAVNQYLDIQRHKITLVSISDKKRQIKVFGSFPTDKVFKAKLGLKNDFNEVETFLNGNSVYEFDQHDYDIVKDFLFYQSDETKEIIAKITDEVKANYQKAKKQGSSVLSAFISDLKENDRSTTYFYKVNLHAIKNYLDAK